MSVQLTLSGEALAKIFLGEVKAWDDTAIKKLNPSVKLPSQAIVVIRRSDGSGTTFVFTDYLAKVSPDWKAKVGVNTALEWSVGIGAKWQRDCRQQRHANEGLDWIRRVRSPTPRWKITTARWCCQISEFSGNRTEFFARACQKRAVKWLQNLIVSQGLKTSSAWS